MFDIDFMPIWESFGLFVVGLLCILGVVAVLALLVWFVRWLIYKYAYQSPLS